MNLHPKRALQTLFGYDATKASISRKRPSISISSEDVELNSIARRKLVATSRDQTRNISIVSWMFRKHLDYVSQFSFHAMTDNESLNERLDELWKEYNRKNNCDIAGRHSLNRMIRLFEASKVIDGDAGLLKLRNGKLQGIEGTRIAKPTIGVPNHKVKEASRLTDHGLILNKYGMAEKFSIVRIKNGSKYYEGIVSADDILFDGYFTRFAQTRGISPLSAALNTFQDLHESWRYQLIKAKLHAMFGIAIMSGDTSVDGSGFDNKDLDTGNDPTSATTNYDFEVREGGMKMYLDPGDTIDTIESKTPSAEFRDYTELMVRMGLLALDIPFSFYDSRQSSYSAMKQDRVEYENSALVKQESNHDVLMELSNWKHEQWSKENLLYGVDPSIIKFEWRSIGRPWLEEVKEIDAAMRRIDSGLSSRQMESKKRGQKWEETMRQLTHEKSVIDKSGVNIVSGMPGQTTIPERDASISEIEGEETETDGGENNE